MSPQLTPAAGRPGGYLPQPRTGSHQAASDVDRDVGVLPGESDPTRMLSGVLLLAIATIIIALALIWWLI